MLCTVIVTLPVLQLPAKLKQASNPGQRQVQSFNPGLKCSKTMETTGADKSRRPVQTNLENLCYGINISQKHEMAILLIFEALRSGNQETVKPIKIETLKL